jgi:hypothetical protein
MPTENVDLIKTTNFLNNSDLFKNKLKDDQVQWLTLEAD